MPGNSSASTIDVGRQAWELQVKSELDKTKQAFDKVLEAQKQPSSLFTRASSAWASAPWYKKVLFFSTIIVMLTSCVLIFSGIGAIVTAVLSALLLTGISGLMHNHNKHSALTDEKKRQLMEALGEHWQYATNALLRIGASLQGEVTRLEKEITRLNVEVDNLTCGLKVFKQQNQQLSKLREALEEAFEQMINRNVSDREQQQAFLSRLTDVLSDFESKFTLAVAQFSEIADKMVKCNEEHKKLLNQERELLNKEREKEQKKCLQKQSVFAHQPSMVDDDAQQNLIGSIKCQF